MTAITVVGAGIVGTSLATAAHRLGHDVAFAARDPESDKVTAALASLPGTTVRPLDRAGAGADLVVLAVPFAAVEETVRALGDLGDAVLVDATNPVGAALPDGAETVVDLIGSVRPDLRIVKAFNTIGAEAYLDPVIDGRPAFLPVAGDDDAVDQVVALASAMGFDALAVGGREAVIHLEHLARLWIHLAFGVGIGRRFAFARVSA